MKKILLINSSKRKRNTYKLLLSIQEILMQNNFESEILNLGDYNIDYCAGCESCVIKGKCSIKDDANLIMQKIIDCDGLVLATPVYLNNMSGRLKSLVDRTCSWFHRSPIYQKPTLILANTQGSGLDNTINSIKEFLIQWGVAICEDIKRKARDFDKPIKQSEMQEFIDLLNENKFYKPSFKEISTFTTQKTLATNIFEFDKKYWQDNNLFQNAYYPGAKVNFIKRTYGNLMYKMLCKVIKPIDR